MRRDPAGRNAVRTLTPRGEQAGLRVTVTFTGTTDSLLRVGVARFHTGELVTSCAVLDRGCSSVGVAARTPLRCQPRRVGRALTPASF